MQSQVLNHITFSLFFILFFSWQPKTVFNLLILFPSLFQSDTGTAWIHVMNGRMPQFQVNNNVLPILGTIMLWYLKKKRVLSEGSWCVHFLIYLSLNVSFLQ